MKAIAARNAQDYPQSHKGWGRGRSLHGHFRCDSLRWSLYLLLGAVGAVLVDLLCEPGQPLRAAPTANVRWRSGLLWGRPRTPGAPVPHREVLLAGFGGVGVPHRFRAYGRA
jgi:hypothetical protein